MSSDPREFDLSKLHPSWHPLFKREFNLPYFAALSTFIIQERSGSIPIYPPAEDVFNAFVATPLDNVRVVIIGQDPYHGPGQAHGLCFSVPHGTPLPPSLKNIYKELQLDLGGGMKGFGCLESWARQGVLLLNTTLTVRQAAPLSHHNKGWEQFTDAAVRALCEKQEPVIFVLWGKSALTKFRHVATSIDENSPHTILQAPHPSPLSAYQGFFGCRHFSTINRILSSWGGIPIDWYC